STGLDDLTGIILRDASDGAGRKIADPVTEHVDDRAQPRNADGRPRIVLRRRRVHAPDSNIVDDRKRSRARMLDGLHRQADEGHWPETLTRRDHIGVLLS